MRVVGGSARGRRLVAPPGQHIRPTSDRVRESVFNMLVSMGVVRQAVVWDLFAGTGAMGIEALSRGAASAVFVDDDAVAVRTIRDNLGRAGVEGGTVVKADVLRWLEVLAPREAAPGLVLCDPPYAFDSWPRVLRLVPAGLVVAESDREIDPGEGWEVLKSRRYGGTVVTLAQPTAAQPTKGGA